MKNNLKILATILLSSILFLSYQSIASAACASTTFDEDGNPISCDGGSITTPNYCSRNQSVCCQTEEECEDVFPVENIIDGPKNEFFDSVNPLVQQSDIADQLNTPGAVVSRVLQFLFPLAGLVLFVMLVWGGFEILSKSTQGTKGLDAGKNRITAAIVGFILLFATYWMAQIIEAIFGIVIV